MQVSPYLTPTPATFLLSSLVILQTIPGFESYNQINVRRLNYKTFWLWATLRWFLSKILCSHLVQFIQWKSVLKGLNNNKIDIDFITFSDYHLRTDHKSVNGIEIDLIKLILQASILD